MTKDEVSNYAMAVAKQRIASICLSLGWNSVGQFSMEILQDLMIRYIRSIGVAAKDSAELCNRTEPNDLDLQRAFDEFDIAIPDLEEFMDKIDDRCLITAPVPKFPAPSETNLNFLKPGSQEVLHRPMHVHDHFPAMYPELEHQGPEDDKSEEEAVKSEDVGAVKSETPMTDKEIKDLNPFREIDSVMMTAAGFISPAREGRLPDARTPVVASSLATKSKEEPKEEGEIEDDEDDDDELPDRPKSNVTPVEPKIPKKRGPKPGSKRKATPKVTKKEDSDTPVSDVEMSDDDNYRPPAGFHPNKKLATSQRKNKPRSVTTGSTPSYDEKSPTNSDTDMKPKAPLTPATPLSSTVVAAKDGTPTPGPKKRGRKKKSELERIRKEKESGKASESSDLDICYDAPVKRTVTTPPVVEKPPEPPVEINIRAPTPPDPKTLPNNPLIPKGLYGFGDLHGEEKKGDVRTPDKDLKKSLKKSKKDKKDKDKDREKKREKRKEEKLGKKKQKKLMKNKRPPSPPPLFAPSEQKIVSSSSSATTVSTSSTSVTRDPSPPSSSSIPKIKIKDLKPEESKSPKIVIKNFIDPDKEKKKKKDPEKKKVKKEKEVKRKEDEPATESTTNTSSPSTSSSFVGGGSITTQTVGKYVDNEGREIWICPGCGKQGDGSPMIGCDSCDDWYHWVCVNIISEPGDEDWFCPRCRSKRAGAFLPTSTPESRNKTPGKRGRPPKHH